MSDEPGILRVVELWERKDAVVLTSKIAAVVTLTDGGPSRLVFSAGGHMDVCGSSEILWRELRIGELLDAKKEPGPVR